MDPYLNRHGVLDNRYDIERYALLRAVEIYLTQATENGLRRDPWFSQPPFNAAKLDEIHRRLFRALIEAAWLEPSGMV